MRVDCTYSEWGGFRRADFRFEDRDALIVFPKCEKNGKWLVKMEYFGAFPELEFEMLNRGWHLAYLQNHNRWGTDDDSDAKARFADFVSAEFGLENRFSCVGMSCGGICSVNFAARHPDKAGVLYLDAPVMNLLSCPCGLGVATDKLYAEFFEAMGLTVSELLNYRSHPVDFIGDLIEHRVPIALVCGDSDSVVPYIENGAILSAAYRKTDIPFFEELKTGCDHHPHGLNDNTQLIDFAEKYYD